MESEGKVLQLTPVQVPSPTRGRPAWPARRRAQELRAGRLCDLGDVVGFLCQHDNGQPSPHYFLLGFYK